ncbi:MAG: hypothetical protein KKB62_01830 [Nanoarchaeota archaeon]|nr:hypothetical protein [Nanoarchaeota archaeon]
MKKEDELTVNYLPFYGDIEEHLKKVLKYKFLNSFLLAKKCQLKRSGKTQL